jgi:tetratricopeptide (TPR) repeat protein
MLTPAFADDPAAEIEQLMKTGEAGYVKADYEAARLSYEKAWELAQQTAAKNPIRYDILKRLTAVSAAVGKFTEADSYLQLAINWRETAIGRDDPKIADDLLVSVGVCRGMKDLDRALAILERIRFMHSQTGGAESIPVASDFSLMAQIYLDQKKLENAINALVAALRIRVKVAGAYDASLLPDMDRLGETLITVRLYDKAEETFRHALVIRESLLGKDSADLIHSIDGLAYACFGQKKYDDAEPLYQRLIALWTASVGREHPMVAMAYDKVAVFYAEQKKFDQAKAAAEHANAIRAHFLALGLAQEANEQEAEGHVDETKALYHRALTVLDPPDPVYADLRKSVESILKILEPPIGSKPKVLKTPARHK